MFSSKSVITGIFLEYNRQYWPHTDGYHTGIDIVPKNADPAIICKFDCSVYDINNNNDSGLGKYVLLWIETAGIMIRLAHLSVINVEKNMHLKHGDKIGVMGGTNGTNKLFPAHVHIDYFPVNRYGERTGQFRAGAWGNPWGYSDPLPVLKLLGVEFEE